MKELIDKTQETGCRLPTPQPTRAQAENFALFVASKLERGVTTSELIDGEYEENAWFAYCPAVLTCGIMPLINKAEAELKHWFIIEETIKPSTRHKTFRFSYDFEKGRFDMATIRKLNTDKKAEKAAVTKANAVVSKTDEELAGAAAKKAEAKAKKIEAAKLKKAGATKPKKTKAEAARMNAAAEATKKPNKKAEVAKPAERPTVTLVVQRTLGGMFIGELQMADGSYKVFHPRRSLPLLFDICQRLCGPMYRIAKINVKAVELTATEKKELKAWGSFE